MDGSTMTCTEDNHCDLRLLPGTRELSSRAHRQLPLYRLAASVVPIPVDAQLDC
jgi:hypothetical protein